MIKHTYICLRKQNSLEIGSDTTANPRGTWRNTSQDIETVQDKTNIDLTKWNICESSSSGTFLPLASTDPHKVCPVDLCHSKRDCASLPPLIVIVSCNNPLCFYGCISLSCVSLSLSLSLYQLVSCCLVSCPGQVAHLINYHCEFPSSAILSLCLHLFFCLGFPAAICPQLSSPCMGQRAIW